jgi:hypothetical protein
MGNASRGPTVYFNVYGGVSDNSAPVISNIDMPQTAVAGDTITVRISATDETGVAGVYSWFLLDGGGFSDGRIIYAMPSEALLVNESGDSKTFEQKVLFDPAAPAGTYTLWISVKDIYGNRDFASSGQSITITK